MKLKRVLQKNWHEHDDYSIFVFSNYKTRISDPIESYHTVSFFLAIKQYIKYSHGYPTATIIFKHNRYY